MLLANCYVRINGKVYMRGEKIPDNLTEEKINWLTKAGAIKEFAPSVPQEENAADEANEEPEDTAEEEREETGTEAEEAQEEADDDAEVPEIDVMAGIVQGDTEEEPKKTTRAKSAARKQAGRRKNG